jgi:hypothetical protein
VAIEASTPRAGRTPVTPKRGMPVTLMIPRALLKEDGRLALRNVPIVSADITGAEGEGTSVNGISNWMQAGLPSMIEASIKKITRHKEHTELELRADDVQNNDVVVKLRFAHSLPDARATLGEMVIEGGADTAAVRKYRDEAHAAVASAVFSGSHEGLSDDRKRAILATLQRSPGAPDVYRHESQVLASYDLGVDATVFNDRTADEGTIVGQVLDETILPRVREMAKSLEKVPELHGMRLLYRIPHKPRRSAATKEYRVEVIARMEDVVRFVSTEFTHQEFLDAATIIVDGNPVRIAVNASAPDATAAD